MMVIIWLMVINRLSGWWLTYPSEKYEFVSWDYNPQYMEKNVPNHQPVMEYPFVHMGL